MTRTRITERTKGESYRDAATGPESKGSGRPARARQAAATDATVPNPCANDAALRLAVHQRLAAASSRGVNEVCIRGLLNRLDMVGMLDGMLCGFELKADNDTLARLRDQARAARPRFRRLVLVVGPRLMNGAVEQVPGWWGVWLASPTPDNPGAVTLTVEREARENPRFNRLAQAKLLRKAELRGLLTRQSVDLSGIPNTRNALAQAAADEIPVEMVEAGLVAALAARRARCPTSDGLKAGTSGSGRAVVATIL